MVVVVAGMVVGMLVGDYGDGSGSVRDGGGDVGEGESDDKSPEGEVMIGDDDCNNGGDSYDDGKLG